MRGARDASPATDQWSLGLVAFRALAGIEYFGHIRGVPALVLAIATERMPPPSERAPHAGFSRAFDGWFLRSCARAPADRFPDVAAQVAALGAALGNPQPEVLAPDGDGPRSPVRHAAATDPTVAAKPAAPSVATGERRSAARLVYIAGATLWALVALGWITTRSSAGDGAPAAGRNEQGERETQRKPEPASPDPEPSETSLPPLLPVKTPEPTPAPAVTPVAPPAAKREEGARGAGAAAAAGRALPPIVGLRQRAVRRGDVSVRPALAAAVIAAAVCAAGGSARADAYNATLTRAIAAKERAMDVNEPARWEEALRLFQEADAIRATREASYELGHAAERLRAPISLSRLTRRR